MKRTTHFEIEWDETTGIRQPEAVGSNHAEAEYFSLSGQHLPAPRKGLNVVMTKDGQIRKVVVR